MKYLDVLEQSVATVMEYERVKKDLKGLGLKKFFSKKSEAEALKDSLSKLKDKEERLSKVLLEDYGYVSWMLQCINTNIKGAEQEGNHKTYIIKLLKASEELLNTEVDMVV